MFYKMSEQEFWFQLLNNQVIERIGEKYKKTQYIRDIVVKEDGQNTHYSFSFTGGANKQLLMAFGNCAMQGGSPLEYNFKLRKYILQQKEGEFLEEWQRTRYNVIGGDRIGIPQNIQEPNIVQETPISVEQANKQYNIVELPMFELPKTVIETPSPEEMQIIQWAKNYQDKLTEQQFIEGFNHNLKKNFNKVVADERARKWFYQYYQKI